MVSFNVLRKIMQNVFYNLEINLRDVPLAYLTIDKHPNRFVIKTPMAILLIGIPNSNGNGKQNSVSNGKQK